MHLVAVTAGRRRAVVADRDAAGSGTSGSDTRPRRSPRMNPPPRNGSSRRARCARTATGSRPRAVAPLQRRRHRDGLLAARTGRRPRGGPAGSRRRPAGRARRRCRAPRARSALPTPESWSSCGELIAPPQRITSPASTRSGRHASATSTPTARVPSKSTRVDERAASHLEVRAPQDRVQVRARRAEAPAAVDVAVEGREALLPVPVDVVRERVARLLHRVEERVEERARRRAALEHERTVAAAPLVGAREAGLHPLEVRQAVRVVPRLHARVGAPSARSRGGSRAGRSSR